MSSYEGPGTEYMEADRVPTARMLEIGNGDVDRKILESFVDRGLLPRRERARGQSGKRPVWTYPPGTDRQLVSLLFWRKQSRDPDRLRIALWTDGYTVPEEAVRESLAQVVDDWVRPIVKATQPVGTEGDEPIHALANKLAGKRGDNPVLPRHRRVSAEDRAATLEAVLRAFVTGDRPPDAEAEERGKVFETLTGSARGRVPMLGSTTPWLTGPAATIFEAITLTEIHEAAQSASTSDLVQARQLVVALTVNLPVLASILASVAPKQDGGFSDLQKLLDNIDSRAFFLAYVIALLRRDGENLRAMAQALDFVPALVAGTADVQNMRVSMLNEKLAGQPEEIKARVKSLAATPLDEITESLARRAKPSRSAT